MIKSILPTKGTPEANAIIKEYLECSNDEIAALALRVGYKNRGSFVTCMKRHYGVTRTYNAAPITLEAVETPEIKIPEIKVMKYASHKGRRGDPETQVLKASDWHYGEITPTFNPEVADQRVDAFFQHAMRITELHRHMYPINDVVLLLEGDMTHGENPYQGAKVEAIRAGAMTQVYEMAFPKLRSFIGGLRENFRKVTVYGVPGNHGRVSRESPDTSNWDLMLYNTLKIAKWPAGVEIVLPNDFCQLVDISGFRFFVHHGDATRMTNGIPYFAQTRKALSWHSSYKGFSYISSGHIHKDDFYRISSETKQITNGSLVSDDPYALKVIGTSTIPSQTTFGVHERRGVSWYYALTLSDDYLPDKIKGE